MTRQPTSRTEKFVEGLKKLLILQPAARIEIVEDKFFVGDAADNYLSKGIKDYIVNMGFRIEAGRFVFDNKEENRHGKRKN